MRKKALPEPPETLNDTARTWWRDNIPHLVEKFKDYDNSDYNNWVNLAEWHSTLVAAQKELDKGGYVVDGPKGKKSNKIVNPWFTVRDKAQKQYTELLREYGLTPLAFAKIEQNCPIVNSLEGAKVLSPIPLTKPPSAKALTAL